MKDIVSDVPARPTGVVMTTACEELVGGFCCVQDYHALTTELEVINLPILSSPLSELKQLSAQEAHQSSYDAHLRMRPRGRQLEQVAEDRDSPWPWRKLASLWPLFSVNSKSHDGEKDESTQQSGHHVC